MFILHTMLLDLAYYGGISYVNIGYRLGYDMFIRQNFGFSRLKVSLILPVEIHSFDIIIYNVMS